MLNLLFLFLGFVFAARDIPRGKGMISGFEMTFSREGWAPLGSFSENCMQGRSFVLLPLYGPARATRLLLYEPVKIRALMCEPESALLLLLLSVKVYTARTRTFGEHSGRKEKGTRANAPPRVCITRCCAREKERCGREREGLISHDIA